jgi:hypothetical protein
MDLEWVIGPNGGVLLVNRAPMIKHPTEKIRCLFVFLECVTGLNGGHPLVSIAPYDQIADRKPRECM